MLGKNVRNVACVRDMNCKKASLFIPHQTLTSQKLSARTSHKSHGRVGSAVCAPLPHVPTTKN
jgi:hypothetical protein